MSYFLVETISFALFDLLANSENSVLGNWDQLLAYSHLDR